MPMREALTHRQKEWAYNKWCLGFTKKQIADALFVCEKNNNKSHTRQTSHSTDFNLYRGVKFV